MINILFRINQISILSNFKYQPNKITRINYNDLINLKETFNFNHEINKNLNYYVYYNIYTSDGYNTIINNDLTFTIKKPDKEQTIMNTFFVLK